MVHFPYIFTISTCFICLDLFHIIFFVVMINAVQCNYMVKPSQLFLTLILLFILLQHTLLLLLFYNIYLR